MTTEATKDACHCGLPYQWIVGGYPCRLRCSRCKRAMCRRGTGACECGGIAARYNPESG